MHAFLLLGLSLLLSDQRFSPQADRRLQSIEELSLDFSIDDADPRGKIRIVVQAELVDDLLRFSEQLSECIDSVLALVQVIDVDKHQMVQAKNFIDLFEDRAYG